MLRGSLHGATKRAISGAMKLTIIQTGDVPAPLRPRFGAYPPMFKRMFDEAGQHFDYETVPVFDGAGFPDPTRVEVILITGSAAGVYEDHAWLEPLRAFIRSAYAANTPMLGICFGHQIMADALGGDVRKSARGWGLGRHTYAVKSRPDFLATDLPALSIACSHQDQVITPPGEADVFLGSDFTPNAGLVYKNGKALSLQPHPEFSDDYTLALAELRRGKAPDEVVENAVASVATPSHSRDMAGWLGGFLTR
ncbi:MAG: gamma-glutamyl-gamma-aminobutyrate hydrolase family protein [Devosia sp.]|uniref:type 1 glutamine amidotransferase n=1 Tax=Devosia sp. TaxID=1871048 RepID=UPI001AD0ECD8|nr:gamma-glutamyl-gamma-aminobutyrate hydrolase family protein [Devosia sp.]MBN9314928.1 gamma-glutamyl-gamma-aminobutyrate hydrolase family protein [Devosia sp.]